MTENKETLQEMLRNEVVNIKVDNYKETFKNSKGE